MRERGITRLGTYNSTVNHVVKQNSFYSSTEKTVTNLEYLDKRVGHTNTHL